MSHFVKLCLQANALVRSLASKLLPELRAALHLRNTLPSNVLNPRRRQPHQIDVALIQRMIGRRHGQIGAGQRA